MGCLAVSFLGTSSHSTDVIPLLQTLLSHVTRLYMEHITDDKLIMCCSSSDYKTLCATLAECLSLIPESKPLVLFLDSLDQLSSLNKSKQLDFLPTMCFNNAVRIIVSTLPEPEYEIWPRLLQLYPPGGPSCVDVPLWTDADGATVLAELLKLEGMVLTVRQSTHIVEKFRNNPSPLYLVLMFFNAKDWRAIEEERWDVNLPDDVPSCIVQVYMICIIYETVNAIFVIPTKLNFKTCMF